MINEDIWLRNPSDTFSEPVPSGLCGNNFPMNNDSMIDRHAASARRTGLIIAIVASLVLIALAAYRVPLFHTEFHGIIIGVSEVHNETGSELIAAVQLDNGVQVLVSMPLDLLKSENNNVRIDEGRTLFGRKSYIIIASND